MCEICMHQDDARECPAGLSPDEWMALLQTPFAIIDAGPFAADITLAEGEAILEGQFAYEQVFLAFMDLPEAEARQGFQMLAWLFDDAPVEPADDLDCWTHYRFPCFGDAQLVTVRRGLEPEMIIDFSLCPDRSSRPFMPVFGEHLPDFDRKVVVS